MDQLQQPLRHQPCDQTHAQRKNRDPDHLRLQRHSKLPLPVRLRLGRRRYLRYRKLRHPATPLRAAPARDGSRFHLGRITIYFTSYYDLLQETRAQTAHRGIQHAALQRMRFAGTLHRVTPIPGSYRARLHSRRRLNQENERRPQPDRLTAACRLLPIARK